LNGKIKKKRHTLREERVLGVKSEGASYDDKHPKTKKKSIEKMKERPKGEKNESDLFKATERGSHNRNTNHWRGVGGEGAWYPGGGGRED